MASQVNAESTPETCKDCILFKDSSYTMSISLPAGIEFDDAVEKVKAAFASVGFGMPPGTTNLDLPKIFESKKIDFPHPNFKVLGFCSPRHAAHGMTIEPNLAMLIPCNVSIATNSCGNVEVSTIDPYAFLGVASNKDQLREFVDELRAMSKAGLAATLAACPTTSS